MKSYNFGSMFAIWNQLFGIYVNPNTVRADFPRGLPSAENLPRMIVGV